MICAVILNTINLYFMTIYFWVPLLAVNVLRVPHYFLFFCLSCFAKIQLYKIYLVNDSPKLVYVDNPTHSTYSLFYWSIKMLLVFCLRNVFYCLKYEEGFNNKTNKRVLSNTRYIRKFSYTFSQWLTRQINSWVWDERLLWIWNFLDGQTED